MTLDATIGLLASAAIERRLLIFVGAGASISHDTGLPSGSGLAKELAKRFGVSPKDLPGLGLIAEIVETKHGRGPLEEFLRKRFRHPGGTTTSTHGLLAQIPVEHFITTNYDTLIEQSLAKLGAQPQVVTAPRHLMRMSPDQVKVIKIHGCVSDDNSEFIITERDYYERFLFSNNFFMEAITVLMINNHCLFVGYSLDDVNFRHIYFSLCKRLGRDQVMGRFFSIQRSVRADVASVWAARGFQILRGDHRDILAKMIQKVSAASFSVSNGIVKTTKDTILGRLTIDLIRELERKNGEHEQRFIVLPRLVMERSGLKDGDAVSILVGNGGLADAEYASVFGKASNDGEIGVPRVMLNSLNLPLKPRDRFERGSLTIRKLAPRRLNSIRIRHSETIFKIEKEYYDLYGGAQFVCALRAREFDMMGLGGPSIKVVLEIGTQAVDAICVKMVGNPGRALLGVVNDLFDRVSKAIDSGGRVNLRRI